MFDEPDEQWQSVLDMFDPNIGKKQWHGGSWHICRTHPWATRVIMVVVLVVGRFQTIIHHLVRARIRIHAEKARRNMRTRTATRRTRLTGKRAAVRSLRSPVRMLAPLPYRSAAEICFTAEATAQFRRFLCFG